VLDNFCLLFVLCSHLCWCAFSQTAVKQTCRSPCGAMHHQSIRPSQRHGTCGCCPAECGSSFSWCSCRWVAQIAEIVNPAADVCQTLSISTAVINTAPAVTCAFNVNVVIDPLLSRPPTAPLSPLLLLPLRSPPSKAHHWSSPITSHTTYRCSPAHGSCC
jgi:hypothetical protein